MEACRACWSGCRAVPEVPATPSVRDDRTPVAALRHETRVSEALHQLDPGTCHVVGVPAGVGRLAGEPVARHRRNHQMERVRCAAAVRRGSVSGPMIFSCSMIEPGQPCVTMSGRRVLMLRADVNEVDVEPVDLGDELRQGVQFRLALAPVVVRRPNTRECLNRRELHALRLISDGLPLGPARGLDARAQLLELRLGDLDRERPDRGVRRLTGMWVPFLGSVTRRSLLPSPRGRARRTPWSPPWSAADPRSAANESASAGSGDTDRLMAGCAQRRRGAGCPGESCPKLPTRGNAELGEDLAQMPFDGARADEELRADLRIREAVACEPRDLLLLRSGSLASRRSACGLFRRSRQTRCGRVRQTLPCRYR